METSQPKYRLEKTETISTSGKPLFRVVALMSFHNVREGDVGGLVEGEHNLSHKGDAWVGGDAVVDGNARVGGDALVDGGAWVGDDAVVDGGAVVNGNARVKGKAAVSGFTWVGNDAVVDGNAWVNDYAWVGGHATVYDNGWVGGDARVDGNACVKGNTWVKGKAVASSSATVNASARRLLQHEAQRILDNNHSSLFVGRARFLNRAMDLSIPTTILSISATRIAETPLMDAMLVIGVWWFGMRGLVGNRLTAQAIRSLPDEQLQTIGRALDSDIPLSAGFFLPGAVRANVMRGMKQRQLRRSKSLPYLR